MPSPAASLSVALVLCLGSFAAPAALASPIVYQAVEAPAPTAVVFAYPADDSSDREALIFTSTNITSESGAGTATTGAPEPASLALLGTGAFGAVLVLRRRVGLR